jgi:hypothetical protein
MVVAFQCEQSTPQPKLDQSHVRTRLGAAPPAGAHARSRTNIPDVNGDLSFAFPDIVAHGRKLHLQRLVVFRGHSRIEADSWRYPVAKNPLRKGLWKPLILRGFAGVIWLWP